MINKITVNPLVVMAAAWFAIGFSLYGVFANRDLLSLAAFLLIAVSYLVMSRDLDDCFTEVDE